MCRNFRNIVTTMCTINATCVDVYNTFKYLKWLPSGPSLHQIKRITEIIFLDLKESSKTADHEKNLQPLGYRASASSLMLVGREFIQF